MPAASARWRKSASHCSKLAMGAGSCCCAPASVAEEAVVSGAMACAATLIAATQTLTPSDKRKRREGMIMRYRRWCLSGQSSPPVPRM